jgi:hypothetical protein
MTQAFRRLIDHMRDGLMPVLFRFPGWDLNDNRHLDHVSIADQI